MPLRTLGGTCSFSVLILFTGLVGAACGRSELTVPPPAPALPECVVDADCEGFDDLCNPVICEVPSSSGSGGADASVLGACAPLTPVDCDDGDPCTIDECESATGLCSYGPATRDNDGDGFKGPREGTVAGEPESCGDDCDDTSALAFPGGEEVCDGVDNDCNGVVDDSATFVPINALPVRISSDGIAPSGRGGLAWSGEHYAAVYWGNADGFDMYRHMLHPDGETFQAEEPITLVNADTSGGPVEWVGDRFGVAWQDRRDGDYEIYFSLLDPLGTKVHPDTRLTFAPDFSVNVDMAWTGQRFVVVWQDRREGLFNIYGQLVTLDGAPEGSNVPLSDVSSGFGNEAPSVAAGVGTLGVAFNRGNASNHFIMFQVYDTTLAPIGEPVPLTNGQTDSIDPVVVYNGGTYVVAWFDRSASPTSIWGAVLDEAGQVLVQPQPITDPGPFRSRYPYLRALGDRLLLVYSDDRDQNNGYELYSRMLTDTLAPLTAEMRLTTAPRDSVYPTAAFGPDGNVGIMFRDDREGGDHHIYFTRLGCVATN